MLRAPGCWPPCCLSQARPKRRPLPGLPLPGRLRGAPPQPEWLALLPPLDLLPPAHSAGVLARCGWQERLLRNPAAAAAAAAAAGPAAGQSCAGWSPCWPARGCFRPRCRSHYRHTCLLRLRPQRRAGPPAAPLAASWQQQLPPSHRWCTSEPGSGARSSVKGRECRWLLVLLLASCSLLRLRQPLPQRASRTRCTEAGAAPCWPAWAQQRTCRHRRRLQLP